MQQRPLSSCLLLLVAVASACVTLASATILQGSYFDVATATRGFLLSRTTTCETGEILEWNCGDSCQANPTLEPVEVLDDTAAAGTFALIGLDHTFREIAVVFRASANLKNWMSNLDFKLVSYPAENGNCAGGCKVHKGFLEAYQSLQTRVRSTVSQLRAEYPSYRLFITGHSLGGALAELCGLDLASYTWPSAAAAAIPMTQAGECEDGDSSDARGVEEDSACGGTDCEEDDEGVRSPSSSAEDAGASLASPSQSSTSASSSSSCDERDMVSAELSRSSSSSSTSAPSQSSVSTAGGTTSSSSDSPSSVGDFPPTGTPTPAMVRVYSYGAPRIGNRRLGAWATGLLWGAGDAARADSMTNAAAVGGLFRVTHGRDPVPHLPPLAFGYRHPATEVYYSGAGGSHLSTDFTLCADNGVVEDCRCSLGVFANRPKDHGYYMGMCAACNCTTFEENNDGDFELSWSLLWAIVKEFLSSVLG